MTSQQKKAPNIEIRLLRYVLAVADALHFGHAAQHLNLSPPSLSKQIRRLEGELGYELFQRGTRNVALTPSGVVFVAQARDILGSIQRAVNMGRAAQRDGEHRLIAAYSPWIRPSLFLRPGVPLTEGSQPQIEWVSMQPAQQIEAIREGRIDAGICEKPVELKGVVAFDLVAEDLVLAIPNGSPLCSLGKITNSDLVDHSLILPHDELNPGLAGAIRGWIGDTRHDSEPHYHVSGWFELVDMVAGGLGVGFIHKSIAGPFKPSLAIHETVHPPPIVTWCLITRPPTSLPAFAEYARSILQRRFE